MNTPALEPVVFAPFQARDVPTKQVLLVASRANKSDSTVLMPSLPDQVPSLGRRRPALRIRPTGIAELPSECETSYSSSCMPPQSTTHKPSRGGSEGKPPMQFRLKKRPLPRPGNDLGGDYFMEDFAAVTTSKLSRTTPHKTPPRDDMSSLNLFLPIM